MRPLLTALLLVCFFLAVSQSEEMAAPVTDNTYPKFHLYGFNYTGCRSKVDAITQELATLKNGFPKDWTIAITCNDIECERVMQRADRPPTLTAFTNIPAKLSVVRGDILTRKRSAYRHTLAHELGHILGNCASEDAAERIAYDVE